MCVKACACKRIYALKVSACKCPAKKHLCVKASAYKSACVCVSVRLQEKSDRDSEHTRRRYRHSRKTSTPTHMSHAHTNKKATKGKNRRELGEVSFRILWTSLDWVFQPMVPLPGPPGRRCQRHKKPSGLAAAHL